MAISIVNTTTHNVSNTTTNTTSIPATSANNTLVVLIALRNTGIISVSVADNELDPSAYVLQESYFETGSISYGYAISYRKNIPAGLTTVTVTCPPTPNSISVTVLEVSGVNIITPVDTSGETINQSYSTSDPSGPTLSAATASSLFVGVGVTKTNNSLTGLNNSWTSVNSGGIYIQGYKIASGSQTYSPTRFNNNSATYTAGVVVFSPLANSFTLNFSEGVSTSDALVNESDFVKEFMDGASLADIINLVLFTGSHFKALSDMIVTADSFARIWTALRTFMDEVILTDEVTFIHNVFRTFSDSVTLLDWLSIKRSSNDWGD